MPTCPTRFFSFYGTQILSVILPVLAKVIIYYYGMGAFKTFMYYIAAFLFVKVVGICTILIGEASGAGYTGLKCALAFVFSMICSGFIFEFTSAALMIFMIEITIAVYCLMIFGFVMLVKDTVMKLYNKFLQAFFPH